MLKNLQASLKELFNMDMEDEYIVTSAAYVIMCGAYLKLKKINTKEDGEYYQ